MTSPPKRKPSQLWQEEKSKADDVRRRDDSEEEDSEDDDDKPTKKKAKPVAAKKKARVEDDDDEEEESEEEESDDEDDKPTKKKPVAVKKKAKVDDDDDSEEEDSDDEDGKPAKKKTKPVAAKKKAKVDEEDDDDDDDEEESEEEESDDEDENPTKKKAKPVGVKKNAKVDDDDEEEEDDSEKEDASETDDDSEGRVPPPPPPPPPVAKNEVDDEDSEEGLEDEDVTLGTPKQDDKPKWEVEYSDDDESESASAEVTSDTHPNQQARRVQPTTAQDTDGGHPEDKSKWEVEYSDDESESADPVVTNDTVAKPQALGPETDGGDPPSKPSWDVEYSDDEDDEGGSKDVADAEGDGQAAEKSGNEGGESSETKKAPGSWEVQYSDDEEEDEGTTQGKGLVSQKDENTTKADRDSDQVDQSSDQSIQAENGTKSATAKEDDSTAEESQDDDSCDGAPSARTLDQNNDAEMEGIVHRNIRFKKSSGCITLSKTELCFQPEDAPQADVLRVSYDNISKQQASPPAHPKSLLKLVLSDGGQGLTFELSGRAALEGLRKDIADKKESDTKADAKDSTNDHAAASPDQKSSEPTAINDSDAYAIIEHVELKGISGSLLLMDEQIKFKPKESNNSEGRYDSILWSDILKQQGTPAKSSKAMMKVSLQNGQSLTISFRERPSMEKLQKEIAKKRRSGGKEDKGGSDRGKEDGNDRGTDVEKQANVEASAISFFPRVAYQTETGSISLFDKHFLYSSNEAEGTKISVNWVELAKFQASPPAHPKAMLKVTLKSEKKLTFQLENSDELVRLKSDLAKLWNHGKGNASTASGSPQETPLAVFEKVSVRESVGQLSLTSAGLDFQASGTDNPENFHVPWKLIEKQQASPPSHPVSMLKLVLSEGKPIKLNLESRPVLMQLRDAIATEGKNLSASSNGLDSKKIGLKSSATQGDSNGAVYGGVKFKSRSGSLRLSDTHLLFEPDNNGESTGADSVEWEKVTKTQATPASSAKSMMKVMLKDGKALTFQLEERETMMELQKDINQRRRSPPATQSQRSVSPSRTKGRQSEVLSKVNEDAADSTVYDDVQHKSKTGSLRLTNKELVFEPNGDGEGAKPVGWDKVARTQGTPASSAKVMLKVVMTDGDALAFQLKDRPVLVKLQKDIQQRRYVAAQAAKGGSAEKEYKSVRSGTSVGTLQLTKDQLVFVPDDQGGEQKTVAWRDVAKQQSSPKFSPKAMLKLQMGDGTSVTFQLNTREDLDEINDIVKKHLSANKSAARTEPATMSDKVYTKSYDVEGSELDRLKALKDAKKRRQSKKAWPPPSS
ncbi:expressed unknown protein [Seminavis robusta]|uniref:TFIIH p62 subunit N-terminal domain-containing protein n=1 Tax=Seminavis robusta TaxID=568900 RepID=A0A9N8DRF0_9STRA|nr:expressed unknown protein [Seminavis robusta]|eukprot:Sro286_g108360.1 n/a (1307) ;mRNA; f:51176-55096